MNKPFPASEASVTSHPDHPRESHAPATREPSLSRRPAFRGAVLYVVVATAWIVCSDRALATLVPDHDTLARYSILKGAAFVGATGLLLYWLLERHSRKHAADTFKWRSADAQWRGLADRLNGELARSERSQKVHLQTENRMRILLRAVEQSPASILITNTQGEIDYVNARFTQVTGYTLAEVRGRNPRILKSDTTPSEVYDDLWETLTQGREWRGDLCNRRKNGETFWESAAISPILDPDGKITHFLAVKEDITSRKEADNRLRASEERFREVVETISEVFWVYDPVAEKVTYVSPSFARIWGRPVADIGALRKMWIDSIHDEDRDRVVASMQQRRGERIEQIYRINRADGAVRWVRDQAFCVKSATGEVTRVVGVAEDITEMKEMERRFLRTQRLEAIGTLASGVAHDINNILAPILFVPALLRERLTSREDRELLQLVEQSAQRGANIVRQLLTYSRGSEREPQALQLDHLAKDLLHFMRETFPREITVEWRCAAGLPAVIADATQLHQVFLNLCVNARDAMPHGGRLLLAAEAVVLDAAEVARHDASAPGRYIRIRFQDTGTGIPRHLLERIFDPFFTTKPVGKGTGLGLSTVMGIVRSHGGFVAVESTEGVGSTFDVHLPAAADVTATVPASAAETLPRGAGELVLIVDDEASVRTATECLLQKFGYRAVTAEDGIDALARWSPEVKLVLTDLMMPRMNGYALIRALRERALAVPVIAASGLESNDGDRLRKEFSVSAVLPKPTTARDILIAIHRALGGLEAG